jgi:integrase
VRSAQSGHLGDRADDRLTVGRRWRAAGSIAFSTSTSQARRRGPDRREDTRRRPARAPALIFHDLRHTGNHLAAESGASTRELMHRMGHSTMAAALRYQHATDERARQIADRLSEVVESRMTGTL